MDPNVTLNEARQALAEYDQAADGYEDYDQGLVERLAERFRALDEWITGGGCLPMEWSK